MTQAISLFQEQRDSLIVSQSHAIEQVHHSGCVLTSPRPLSRSKNGHFLLAAQHESDAYCVDIRTRLPPIISGTSFIAVRHTPYVAMNCGNN